MKMLEDKVEDALSTILSIFRIIENIDTTFDLHELGS
jgi:hypothetical protein